MQFTNCTCNAIPWKKTCLFCSGCAVIAPLTTAAELCTKIQFEHEGHCSSSLTTVVVYVLALHDLLHLWHLRVVDGRVGCLHSRSIEQLYPLSPFQKAILQDIVDSPAQRQRFSDQSADDVSPSSDWRKFRLLLGKPRTGKSQVVIRAIHHAIHQECAVLLVAPVALLAKGYRAIFSLELQSWTKVLGQIHI